MGIGFGVGIVLARVYGPEGFGSLSYVIALASIIGSFASLGFDDLLPRDLAAEDRNVQRLDAEKTAMILRLGAELLAYLGLLIFMGVTQGKGPLFWITAVYGSYFLFQATDVVEFGRRVEGHFREIARLRCLASLVAGGLKLAAAWLDLPLLAIAFAMIAEYLFASLYYLARIKRDRRWSRADWNPDYAKSLLQRGTFLVISGLFATLQSRIDSLLIEHFLGLESVGQYAAALRMVELFDAFGIVLSILLIPEFGRRKGVELERYARSAYLAGILLFGVALPGLYLLWLIFPFVYGAAYTEGQSLMPWLFPRPFLYLLGMIRMGLLLTEQQYGRLPLYAGCSVVITALGFGPLTERYEIEGAAMAGTLGLLVSGFGLDLLIYPKNLRRLLLSLGAFPDLIKIISKT